MTTAIEWTDATWNPTTGCDRISPGCDHCYALTLAKRLKSMGQAKYQNDGDPRTSGPGFAFTQHADALGAPLHWAAPRKVFVNSMSDLFHQDATPEFVASVFAVMAATPRHTYQVLTKRPQTMRWMLEQMDPGEIRIKANALGGPEVIPWPLENVWLGTSIENDRYSFRAGYLRRTPAAVRFLSLEPLLGPLPRLDLTGIDWAIVGGESGPGARPMHPAWVREIRDRCLAAGDPDGGPHGWGSGAVAFFLKQWGEWCPPNVAGLGTVSATHRILIDGRVLPMTARLGMDHLMRPTPIARAGKARAGRMLDGRTWDEYPR